MLRPFCCAVQRCSGEPPTAPVAALMPVCSGTVPIKPSDFSNESGETGAVFPRFASLADRLAMEGFRAMWLAVDEGAADGAGTVAFIRAAASGETPTCLPSTR